MAKKTSKRPGVILYYDILPPLRRLSKEEKGDLFEAILDFAQYGNIPDFSGGLGVAWDFIMPRIVRDEERYREVCQKNSDNANKRWHKEDTPECDRIKEDTPECDRMRDNANNANYNSNINSTTTPTETSTATSTRTGAGEGKTTECKGEGEGTRSHEMPRPLSESEEAARRAMFYDQLKNMT